MSDGEIFLLVFTAIYLADCLLWDSPAAAGFVSQWRKRWRLRRPGETFGNDTTGVLLLWPLPPLGTAFVVPPPHVVMSPSGITTVSTEMPNPGPRVPQPHQFAAWSTIETVEWEERHLFINGSKFTKCATNLQAAQFARRIKRLSQMSPEARVKEIHRGLRSSLRPQRVRRLTDLFFKATGWLRFLCILLMLVTFVALPLTYRYWGAERPTFAVMLMMLMLMLNGTAETFRLHRLFYPKARGERWQQLFLQFLLPQHGIRALDFLSRRYFERFHPLAVASALFKPEQFQEIAATYYRDLRFPVRFHSSDHSAAQAAEAYRNTVLLPEIEAFLHSEGISPTDLLERPPDQHSNATAYCPRCHAEFITAKANCIECGERPVTPFTLGKSCFK